MLNVRGLRVHFPGAASYTPAHVDISVGRGEHVLVLGPSGSGKSALLKAIAGVIPDIVDADVYGDIDLAGIDHRHATVAQIADRIGYLGQDPLDQIALPRVDDEVAFGLENAGVPRGKICLRVSAALAAVGASELADRSTATLSGGQLQRVALAAVLSREPRLLLADEPTAMLDPLAALHVQHLLRRLAAQGPSSVIIDHQLEDAAELPERVVVLDRTGAVLVAGPTPQIICTHAQPIAASGCWLPLGVEAAVAAGRTPTAADLVNPAAALTELASALPRADRAASPVAVRVAGEITVHAVDAAFSATRRAPALIRGVDVELRRGTITAVIGANGSGKTSLLLGLAGLLPTTHGAVRRDGHVGMVFQHPERQFLCRTVQDEIAYGAADPALVETLLAEFDLHEVREGNPFALSGGQQRRLSLAAVVATAAPTLLLDEPSFGQDRAHAIGLARTIANLAVEAGHALAFVTHDLRLAAQIADQVVVLRSGQVVACGAAADILSDPRALRAHGIGTSRLLQWASTRRNVDLPRLISSLHGELA